jgi:hypothetical protein
MARMTELSPPLDAPAQGGLRYLFRKATTHDDWARAVTGSS